MPERELPLREPLPSVPLLADLALVLWPEEPILLRKRARASELELQVSFRTALKTNS